MQLTRPTRRAGGRRSARWSRFGPDNQRLPRLAAFNTGNADILVGEVRTRQAHAGRDAGVPGSSLTLSPQAALHTREPPRPRQPV